VLSFVQAWDGMVSCLRTRSFEDTSRLTERALGKKASLVGERNTGVVGGKNSSDRVWKEEVFSGEKVTNLAFRLYEYFSCGETGVRTGEEERPVGGRL
jgi:hypothetical protein